MHGPLAFERDGAVRLRAAALSVLPDLDHLVDALPAGQAGLRLHDTVGLARLLDPGSVIEAVAGGVLGPAAYPVRAILFDKSPGTNWSLGWHQDRTIAVRRRIDTPDFGPWSTKCGLQHVEPPFGVIERMVTLRIHLDDVPEDNAPLLVAPGSHRLGRIAEDRIEATVAACGIAVCLADRGDVWLYATPILHASAAGHHPHRRVLQVDYSRDSLPGELEWLGIEPKE